MQLKDEIPELKTASKEVPPASQEAVKEPRVNIYDDNRLAYYFTLDDKNIRDFSFEMAG